METVLFFWAGVIAITGVIAISGSVGSLYGAPYGWLTFGLIVTPIAFIAALVTGLKK